LATFAKRVLARVRPAAVIISGDLTDSKTARGARALCSAARTHAFLREVPSFVRNRVRSARAPHAPRALASRTQPRPRAQLRA
jgi:hypothetical protein